MDTTVDATERGRRYDFYRVTSISLIVVFTGFVLYESLKGSLPTILILAGMDLTVIILYGMRRSFKEQTLYRLFCLFITIMLTGYLLDPYAEPFFDVIWVFLMPITYLALLKKREGMVWSAILILVIIGSAVLNRDAPDGFAFDGWVKIISIYTLVIIIQYRNERTKDMIFEITRVTNKALSAERDRLLQAQQEIKTLNKILPICSGCKRIRNEQHEWVSVDAYIPAHTDSHMSHSLCPECMKELYPEFESSLVHDVGDEDSRT